MEEAGLQLRRSDSRCVAAGLVFSQRWPAELVMRLWNVRVSYGSGSHTITLHAGLCVCLCETLWMHLKCMFLHVGCRTWRCSHARRYLWATIGWSLQLSRGHTSSMCLCVCVWIIDLCKDWTKSRSIVARTKAVRSLIETFWGVNNTINDSSQYLLFLFSLIADTVQCAKWISICFYCIWHYLYFVPHTNTGIPWSVIEVKEVRVYNESKPRVFSQIIFVSLDSGDNFFFC